MSMPNYEDDSPSIKELFRTVCDFREEWRSQVAQMVRKDVHAVEHEGLTARLSRIETELSSRIARIEAERGEDKKAQSALRNGIILSVIGAGFSLMVAVVVAAVSAIG